MKKIVVAPIVLAGMVLGTGQAVFAEEQAPTGYETINNAEGDQYDPATGVEIPVKGTLGKLDNTDPEENIPEGDDRWLKVTIPTSVAFNTNPEKENKEIMAYNYTVKNLSGSEEAAITKLSLTPKTGDAIDVVTNGVVKENVNQLLGKLEANVGAYEFTYKGTVDPEKLTGESTKVSYNMNLKFEVLDKNGESVTK
ncbi:MULTISPECIES: hypothetical protein [Carnobacterium]|uniref:hypothetical protein n=1 Tax=Carnobacterium TaxID=2747 RepID=UPI00288DD6BE|nr:MULTISPECIES: hypothetical protein [Carnobacterium]MDT1939859.1 hypothetical protein [Carnobacterium divergens]MDT1942297.1 hypothetical protein [Carnobacterium divergens]MDT1948103.1 hypothetical protein [Carnobacterium divergens]MDT1950583.1 hypothetical protein [Carnobacterium divergens]MDT1955863.1 hypothetical protein [Carnobacterium divergens]